MSHEEVKANSVLVVDDEPGIIDLLYQTLSPNYDIATAVSGSQAIDLHKRSHHAVALVDIGLGTGPDGFEVTRQIKTEHPFTQVIMATGRDDLESVLSAMRAGATDYVVKPFRLQTVSDAVARAAQVYETEGGRNAGLRRIAHELNNKLVPVLGYVQIIGLSADGGSDLKEQVQAIEQSALSCRGLVSQMQDFLIRKGPTQPEVEFTPLYHAIPEDQLTQQATYRIVYIDDQPDLRDFLTNQLTKSTNVKPFETNMGFFGHPPYRVKYEVRTFKDVASFLDTHQNGLGYVDCLVTDREMPEIDGLQLIRLMSRGEGDTLERRPEFSGIGCIVMYTGGAGQSEIDQIGRLGALYMSKAIPVQEVEPHIYRHIMEHKQG